MFSKGEKIQYSRHFLLDTIGMAGQEKLKKSRILVVGAGGLGCPVLQYLTAAGVGTLGIMDGDVVDKTNLQRQILYSTKDIGKSKALCAKERLQLLNPYIDFQVYTKFLTSENALEIFKQYDVIVDGSDNFQTRYLANDAAVLTHKPLVFGAIFQFEGQVSVFNYKGSATYRCLFPEPPKPGSVPNCSEVGVLGVLPGIIGCLQANEALKIICGLKGVLSGKLLSFNALTLSQNLISFKKNTALHLDKLTDYDAFCRIKNHLQEYLIDKKKLNSLLRLKKPPVLLDVRDFSERERYHIGGLHIPLKALENQINALKGFEHIVVYCQSGQRSLKAVQILLEHFSNKNIQSLKGGLASL